MKVLFMQSQPVAYADSMIHAVLMRYLDREKVEVHAACAAGNGNYKTDAFKILETIPNLYLRPTNFGPSILSPHEKRKNFIKSFISLPGSLIGLANYIKTRGIQIIHCSEKPRDAFYGYWLAKASGAKCVIHLHVKVENWISPLTRWVMKRADALVGVSNFVAQSSIAMGYPAERTHYVLNGLDLAGWNGNIDGMAIREEFQAGPNTILMAAIARVVYYKGQGELIQALGRVKEQVPDFKLLVVGEGDYSPGGFNDRLKASAQALGIADRVVFTGHRKDVRQIMAACDIFTLPSFEEPFGMVFVEAMAMQKPIVALDNGGAREIVEHGKSGLLSLPRDIEKLAENTVTLSKDANLRAQMGAYGKKRVETYFHAERMAREFEAFYQSIL